MPEYSKPQKPLKLGQSEGAKRLRKRLGGEKFIPKPPSFGGYRHRGFAWHTAPFGLTVEQLQGKRVLFVGSGISDLILTARKKGVEAIGLEPTPKLTSTDDDQSMRIRGKRFIRAKTIQEFVPRKKFDYVIAVWSVPFHLYHAYDIRLSFFRMLSALNVGGRAYIGPLEFGSGYLEEAPSSIEKKILRAGFKITPIAKEELVRRFASAGITKYRFLSAVTIERTPESDLRKLQELLSL